MLVGIVPRSIDDLFAKLDSAKQADHSFLFQISVSFLELYNEELIDLLNPQLRSKNTPLTIREDGDGGIYWSGVTEEAVNNSNELIG